MNKTLFGVCMYRILSTYLPVYNYTLSTRSTQTGCRVECIGRVPQTGAFRFIHYYYYELIQARKVTVPGNPPAREPENQ